MFSIIWKNRELVLNLVSRDLRNRYAGSMMGILWNVINPLAMIVIYTVIFSQIMRAKLPGVNDIYGYSIYLCSGIFSWMAFQEAVIRGTNVFVENANIIKKISFPREVLLAFTNISSMVVFAISFCLFLAFVLIVGHPITINYLFIIPLMFLQQLFAFALTMGTSVINVYIKDVSQVVNVIFQFWFWMTPIVYPITIIPHKLGIVLRLNPMFYMIEMYHNAVFRGKVPQFSYALIFLGITVLFLFIGAWIFRNLGRDIADEL